MYDGLLSRDFVSDAFFEFRFASELNDDDHLKLTPAKMPPRAWASEGIATAEGERSNL